MGRITPPDGSCIRDYIHILDLAQAHILALKAEKSARFNLGTGGGTSVKEVIQTCRDVTGKDIKAVEKPRRPGDPPRLIASSDGIRNALGWKPKFQDIRTIVESAWAWREKPKRLRRLILRSGPAGAATSCPCWRPGFQ
jgi:UDP-glucose 4-epimerase